MTATVKLRTGAEVAEPLVASTMLALASLDYIALYDLVMWARDPAYHFVAAPGTPPGGNEAKLRDMGLLHNEVREIVLAGTYGSEFSIGIQSPVEDGT